jgi:hypothetical protein
MQDNRDSVVHNLGFDLCHPNTPPTAQHSTKIKMNIGTGIPTGLPHKNDADEKDRANH